MGMLLGSPRHQLRGPEHLHFYRSPSLNLFGDAASVQLGQSFAVMSVHANEVDSLADSEVYYPFGHQAGYGHFTAGVLDRQGSIQAQLLADAFPDYAGRGRFATCLCLSCQGVPD